MKIFLSRGRCSARPSRLRLRLGLPRRLAPPLQQFVCALPKGTHFFGRHKASSGLRRLGNIADGTPTDVPNLPAPNPNPNYLVCSLGSFFLPGISYISFSVLYYFSGVDYYSTDTLFDHTKWSRLSFFLTTWVIVRYIAVLSVLRGVYRRYVDYWGFGVLVPYSDPSKNKCFGSAKPNGCP